MGEQINPRDNNDNFHGYQKWYEIGGKLWYQGCYKHGDPIGYTVANPSSGSIGDEGTIVLFNIK